MLDIIIENFKFLVVEVENQVRATCRLIDEFDVELIDKIEARDDYIDNLKTVVENKCFSGIHSAADHISEKDVDAIRALHVMSVNLEKIADFCESIAGQTDYLSHYAFMHQYPYKKMFDIILAALAKITRGFEKHDMKAALAICYAEYELDRMFKDTFHQIRKDLNQGRQAGDYLTAIFILRYLERMGDSILNIGEAILFAITGNRIKIDQFEALQKTLDQSGIKVPPEDIEFKSIWGSRSGCRISRVSHSNLSTLQIPIIFKEGVIQKVRKEKKNIELWATILPNVTPDIIGYKENGTKASLLMEFMEGQTLEEILLGGPREEVARALNKLEDLLKESWTRTMKNEPVQSEFMRQLESRQDAVHRIHPNFIRPQLRIGQVFVPSPLDLVKVCGRVESKIRAPFRVLLHGDFNLNNILFDSVEGEIKYIDFYRSGLGDYVNDASVLLISHFRLPVPEGPIREVLNESIRELYGFFYSFALAHGDDFFQVRMALALARSLYTSTRFELNRTFAREMFMRAIFLMETISQHKGRAWESYRLPELVLYY